MDKDLLDRLKSINATLTTQWNRLQNIRGTVEDTGTLADKARGRVRETEKLIERAREELRKAKDAIGKVVSWFRPESAVRALSERVMNVFLTPPGYRYSHNHRRSKQHDAPGGGGSQSGREVRLTTNYYFLVRVGFIPQPHLT